MELLSAVASKSPSFTENGITKYVVSHDVLEKLDAENRLFLELERGKFSLENEPTMNLGEFSDWLASV